jgi:hypothetical protein
MEASSSSGSGSGSDDDDDEISRIVCIGIASDCSEVKL